MPLVEDCEIAYWISPIYIIYSVEGQSAGELIGDIDYL
jgi:hypothetical protein